MACAKSKRGGTRNWEKRIGDKLRRTFGKMIGEGLTVFDAISKMSMIVEGYYATKNAYEISKKNQESFDIIDTAYEILYNNKNAVNEIKKLSKKLD